MSAYKTEDEEIRANPNAKHMLKRQSIAVYNSESDVKKNLVNPLKRQSMPNLLLPPSLNLHISSQTLDYQEPAPSPIIEEVPFVVDSNGTAPSICVTDEQ